MCDVKILFLSYLIRLAGVNVTGNDVKITGDDVNLTVRVSVYQDSIYIYIYYCEISYLIELRFYRIRLTLNRLDKIRRTSIRGSS